jgi:hypothetical protein
VLQDYSASDHLAVNRSINAGITSFVQMIQKLCHRVDPLFAGRTARDNNAWYQRSATFTVASLLVQNCSFEFELGSSTELIGGCSKMHLEHPRARRYSFHAGIELTDLDSETQTKAQPVT